MKLAIFRSFFPQYLSMIWLVNFSNVCFLVHFLITVQIIRKPLLGVELKEKKYEASKDYSFNGETFKADF